LGETLLGKQAIAIYGYRFPLLVKFIDASAKLSVQVHPDDSYAAQYEGGKLGKTEFWYILATEPASTIVHGFKAPTSSTQVRRAIEQVELEELLHEEMVAAGDVIFVPAGTVHAIGSGVILYEVQEYSDITYRMYDYGRLTAVGAPRELHVERSLDVSHYDVSPQVKAQPVQLAGGQGHEDRCLIACRYFVARELILRPDGDSHGYMNGETEGSCIILSSLRADVQVRYGTSLTYVEKLDRGQTMVLPAALGKYRIEGTGKLICSYVPAPGDEAWQLWEEQNRGATR
jgi:mannose-6-phosphate isomerase